MDHFPGSLFGSFAWVLLLVQDPKSVSVLCQDLVVDDPEFHIREIHADIGYFEDGRIGVLDHPGFQEIKEGVVYFAVENPDSSAACLHDLFIQGQTEHGCEIVFDLFSFAGDAVGKEIQDRRIHQRVLFRQRHDTYGVEWGEEYIRFPSGRLGKSIYLHPPFFLL